MRRANGNRGRSLTGRILSCLAVVCYLFGPLHPSTTGAAAAQTTVICTSHGLETIVLPGDGAPAAPSGEQDCPACMACAMPCCAGISPALSASAAPLSLNLLTVSPHPGGAFVARAGPSHARRLARGPPISV